MKRSIKDSELRKMSAPQQDAAMRSLVQVAKGNPNGELKDLEARIAEFEKRFELSSDQLRRELAQGKREESWEICQWLMLLEQRDLIGAFASRSH